MNEASLAIARKVVLCAGLLVSALLFAYPHWRGSFDFVDTIYEYDLGRSFITAPPIPDPSQIVRLVGLEPGGDDRARPHKVANAVEASYRVHYVRQLTEVAFALLFTFGLLRALKLKKPAGD